MLFWLAERRGNPEEFRRDPVRGIGDGFWFSAVTMTTVGYGDKAPRTIAGRLIALVWMFTAIIILSTFTGMIASSLTASRINATIRGPADLPDVEVGTVGDSAGDDWMVDNGIGFSRFATTREGLQAVANREIDAFVHDKPLAAPPGHHRVRGCDRRQQGGRSVVRTTPSRCRTTACCGKNSTVPSLEYLDTAAWDELKTRYLGERP